MLTVFLLSPASCAGTRAQLLLNSQTSPLTARLTNGGAPLGEVFSFMSSLYFRGKLAYANAFGRAFVITPGRGLLPADVLIRVDDLRKMATVPVDVSTALTVGNRYEVRNVQDFYGAPVARGVRRA